MKNIAYSVIWVWIRTALTLYFSKIKIKGLSNVPFGKPLMFLANHQNALLDPLLIATHCSRKSYFLTRSDVFGNPVLTWFFEFLQMIPVYRIRDGRDSLKGNKTTFERCSNLLQEGESILLFPEGNHSLKRRVRPLSKGFTRILFLALESNPSLDIGIIPIGVNYAKATKFPDKTALYYGKEIRVQDFFDKGDLTGSASRLKEEVYLHLKKLTTHIEEEEKYDVTIEKLNDANVDYLCPEKVNLLLEQDTALASNLNVGSKVSLIKRLFKWGFLALNFPMILLWSYIIKPKVVEPEFLSTSRFMFALLFYPLFYILLVIGILMFVDWKAALIIGLAHVVLNIVLVKCLWED